MKYMNLITGMLLAVTNVFALSAKGAVPPGPAGALVVDVRTSEEYASGHIPGAVLFPYDLIEAKAADFAALVDSEKSAKDRPIVVYCRSGRRSAIAAQTLAKLGYRNVTDFGGIDRWKGPLER